jgi:hypothetical protein
VLLPKQRRSENNSYSPHAQQSKNQNKRNTIKNREGASWKSAGYFSLKVFHVSDDVVVLGLCLFFMLM